MNPRTHSTGPVSVTFEATPASWAADSTIAANLGGNPLRFLPLEEKWSAVSPEVTTTPASSEIGRVAQLLKAAGLTKAEKIAAPAVPHPEAQLRPRISGNRTT